MVELRAFANLAKEYGPVVGALLAIIYVQARRIEHLLDRNERIYENHIRNLWETQQRLLTSVLGPQQSSQNFPTVADLKKSAAPAKDASKALGEGTK